MKEQIIEEANKLIINRGFNAFSYKNITEIIDIKTSSIHYHFPTKTDLGLAVIKKHQLAFDETIARTKNKSPLDKIDKLFLYYKKLAATEKVCIVGALTSDIETLGEPLRKELAAFSDGIIEWITSILHEGSSQGIFKKFSNNKLKAKQIMASLMALVQIARIEQNNEEFEVITKMIKDELLNS